MITATFVGCELDVLITTELLVPLEPNASVPLTVVNAAPQVLIVKLIFVVIEGT